MAEKTRAEELHDEYRRKVWEDTKSGSENFDKYMLTFSSGALALSLGFIKDVVPLGKAVGLNWLLASWISFVLCILSTLVSFRVSLQALEKMVPHLDAFYLQGKTDAFNKYLDSWWTKAVDWCAYLGIGFFVLGLACTMTFVGKNFREVNPVSKDEGASKVVTSEFGKGLKPAAMSPLTEGLKPVGMSSVTDGVKPMAMAPVTSAPEERGVKPVAMTPTQTVTPAQPSQNSAPVQPASEKK